MAIKFDNKVYRNIQEQVAKNAQDITDFLSGIGYMGPYSTTDAIPTADYKEGQLYIVGSTTSTWHIYKYDETDGFTDLGAAPYLKDQTSLLDSLQSQITSNDTDISALQTRATTAETNISTLQTDLDTVENTYVKESAFTATVEELEDDVATNKTDITNIKADYVTTDTSQTISSTKTFTANQTLQKGIVINDGAFESEIISVTDGVTVNYYKARRANSYATVILSCTYVPTTTTTSQITLVIVTLPYDFYTNVVNFPDSNQVAYALVPTSPTGEADATICLTHFDGSYHYIQAYGEFEVGKSYNIRVSFMFDLLPSDYTA